MSGPRHTHSLDFDVTLFQVMGGFSLQIFGIWIKCNSSATKSRRHKEIKKYLHYLNFPCFRDSHKKTNPREPCEEQKYFGYHNIQQNIDILS